MSKTMVKSGFGVGGRDFVEAFNQGQRESSRITLIGESRERIAFGKDDLPWLSAGSNFSLVCWARAAS